MEWEYLFKNAILERGYDYYLMDKVTITEQSGDHFEAVVSGSDRYDVSIELGHGEVMEMSCTCPFASDGKNCKHMAATLYVVEDLLEEEEENAPSWQVRMNVNQMVESASSEQVRSFLTEILSRDRELCLIFQEYIRPLTAAPDQDSYRKRIDDIIWKYAEPDDWIDYDQTSCFMHEIVDVMTSQTKSAIDSGHLIDAMKMTGYTFMEMADVEMDDSGGELTWFVEVCKSLWEEIYDVAEKDPSGEVISWMFHWFQKNLHRIEFDYMADEMQSFFLTHFDSEEYTEEKDRYIHEKIKRLEKEGEMDGYYGYQLQLLLVARLEAMKNQSASWDALRDYCRQYWGFSDVRQWYMEQCLERKDTDEAIRVLEESKTLDAGMWGLLLKYEKLLWKLYRQQGEPDKSKDSLIHLFIDLQCDDLEYWKELRDSYTPKQWKDVRADLIGRMQSDHQRCLFYREEGMTEQLAEEVLQSKNLSFIRQYKNELLPQYSDGLLHAYETVVQSMARYTSGRGTYQQIVSILREMQKMQGGEEFVQRIKKEFQINYHNRPAMMDELRKL